MLNVRNNTVSTAEPSMLENSLTVMQNGIETRQTKSE